MQLEMGLASVPVEILTLITGGLLAIDILRLYLTGSAILRAKLINGGVKYVFATDDLTCTHIESTIRFISELKLLSLDIQLPHVEFIRGDAFSWLSLLPSSLEELHVSGFGAEEWWTQLVEKDPNTANVHRNVAFHLVNIDCNSVRNDYDSNSNPDGSTEQNEWKMKDFYHFNIAVQFPVLRVLNLDSLVDIDFDDYAHQEDQATTVFFTNENVKFLPPTLTSLSIRKGILLTHECHIHLPRNLISFHSAWNTVFGSSKLEDLPSSLESILVPDSPIL
jgi:hypothetical protein